MDRQNPIIVLILVLVLGAASLAALTYGNYRFAVENPGGSDFLPGWVATRLFLTEGLSPYSDAVEAEIQEQFHGTQAVDALERVIFVYPLYSTLIFGLFALIPDYVLARTLWMTASEMALIAVALLCKSIFRWRMPTWLVGAFLLFSLLWYHAGRAIINGNIVVFVTLLIVLSFWMIREKQDFGAGLLLALASVKPNLVVLVIPLVFIWAASHRRWQVISATLLGLLVLTGIGMVFIPDWILRNLQKIISYTGYPSPTAPGDVFAAWLPGVGRQMGWGLTLILTLILLLEWILVRKKDFRWLMWTACLTLVISQWIGITTDPGNFILLYPALVLILAVASERFESGSRWFSLSVFMLVGFGLWWLFLSTLDTGTQPVQNGVMFFPLPLLLLVGLYWIRWWALHPTFLLADALRAFDES